MSEQACAKGEGREPVRGRDGRPRRRLAPASVALLLSALGAPAVRAEPSLTVLPLGFAVEEFRGPGTRAAQIFPTLDLVPREKPGATAPVAVVWGKAGGAAFSLRNGELRIQPFALPGGEAPAFGEEARGAVPRSRLQASGAITVHLAAPTDAYAHGAIGPTTARELVISERQPVQQGAGVQRVPVRMSKVEAGPDAVFEDLEPRLVDLDRDGSPEVLVVKSTQAKGAALAVVGRRGDAWQILTETPPIGEPERWLNPAATADFAGDGHVEIALVRTPHRDGVLQVWAFEGGRLVLKHERAGYANHAFGSTALDLAAAVDLDGDGVPELAIPTLDRGSLALLSLKGGIREIGRIALPAKVLHGLAALGSGRDTHLLAALEDGRIALIRP